MTTWHGAWAWRDKSGLKAIFRSRPYCPRMKRSTTGVLILTTVPAAPVISVSQPTIPGGTTCTECPSHSKQSKRSRDQLNLLFFWDYDTQWGADADRVNKPGSNTSWHRFEMENTERLLDLHAQYNVPACFAVVGASALPG